MVPIRLKTITTALVLLISMARLSTAQADGAIPLCFKEIYSSNLAEIETYVAGGCQGSISSNSKYCLQVLSRLADEDQIMFSNGGVKLTKGALERMQAWFDKDTVDVESFWRVINGYKDYGVISDSFCP